MRIALKVLSTLVIVTLVVGYLFIFTFNQVSAGAMPASLNIRMSIAQPPPFEVVSAGVTYPPSITTDQQKLYAIYSLIGQMEKEKARQDGVFLADQVTLARKWKTYSYKYSQMLLALLKEKDALKDKIRRVFYADKQWESLSDEEQDTLQDAWYGNKQELKEVPTLASSPLIAQLKAIDVYKLPNSPVAGDPLEDFTSGYTEVDTAGYLTVAANTLTATSVSNTDMYLYKDFGANYFNSLDVLATMQWVSQVGQYPGVGIGFTVSVVNDNTGWGAVDVSMQLRCNAGTYYRWRLIRGSGTTGDYYETTSYLTRYIRLQRSADSDTITSILYPTALDRTNDTNRTDTLSASGFVTTTKYRYFYGIVNKAEVGNNTVIISDVDLQLAGGPSYDISNAPVTWSAGIVTTNGTYSTPQGYFVVNDNSTASHKVAIAANNSVWSSGGVPWVHADNGTPGVNIAAFWASNNTNAFNKLVTNSSPFTNLVDNWPPNTNWSWELRLLAPTGFTDGKPKYIDIRITVSAQ